MTDSGGKQSDHDKQCHSVHRSTPFGESMRLSGAWRKWLPMRVMAISSSVCSGGYVCGTSASMLRARRKNSAASPRTTCRFTSGLMNRKPSWPTSGIALSVTIRRVFFWQRGSSESQSEIVMETKSLSATLPSNTSRKIWAESRLPRIGWRKSGRNARCTVRKGGSPMMTQLAYKKGRPYLSTLTRRYYRAYDAVFEDSLREGGGAEVDFNLYFVHPDGTSEIVF